MSSSPEGSEIAEEVYDDDLRDDASDEPLAVSPSPRPRPRPRAATASAAPSPSSRCRDEPARVRLRARARRDRGLVPQDPPDRAPGSTKRQMTPPRLGGVRRGLSPSPSLCRERSRPRGRHVAIRPSPEVDPPLPSRSPSPSPSPSPRRPGAHEDRRDDWGDSTPVIDSKWNSPTERVRRGGVFDGDGPRPRRREPSPGDRVSRRRRRLNAADRSLGDADPKPERTRRPNVVRSVTFQTHAQFSRADVSRRSSRCRPSPRGGRFSRRLPSAHPLLRRGSRRRRSVPPPPPPP